MMRLSEADPKGLVRESFRIEGISDGECRSIFIDWALSLGRGVESAEALRVVLAEESADREALTKALDAAVQSACRVKVDQVEFVPAEALAVDAQAIVDERSWD